MTMPAATVYLATNKVNGKRYVGVTRKSVRGRFTAHVYHARKKPRTYFHHAIAKYGPEAFTVEAVASCLHPETVSEVERTVIQQLKPEYNQTNGGEFTVGKRVPREVVEKIRAGNVGKKRTPEQNAANSAQAKARWESNPKYREIAVAALTKGRANCDESKRIAAAAASARSRVWTLDSRAKLSASCTGRRHTQGTKDRIAAAKMRPVSCLNTGALYGSISEAAQATGISISGISKVCLGQRNAVNGLRFEFADKRG